MQHRNTASSLILNATSYELKLLVRGILLPSILVFFFIYVIISIVDVERNGNYNSIPSSIILAAGAIVSLKLLFYTKLEKIEIRRFRFIFLALICWLIGELMYVYYQAFLGIADPYPSIADLFYLSATGFLSVHLFSILYLKKSILKNKFLVYLGFVASIFPIYLFIDTIYNYQEYYSQSPLEFVITGLYYASDAVVIFPCIPIILSLSKKDPFIFHWLLITLSVFILVTADLCYTFVASIDGELLSNTEWLWSFVFAIGYLLMSVSILWFSKLKEILEYEKFSNILKYDKNDTFGCDDQIKEVVEVFDDPNQISSSMAKVMEMAKEHVDVLFAQNIIQKDELNKFINILVKTTRNNNLLKVRVLLPSTMFDERMNPRKIGSSINTKYFDRPLAANAITAIVDSEFMCVLGSESNNIDTPNKYFIMQISNEMKIYASIALFEKIWLLEKFVDFG